MRSKPNLSIPFRRPFWFCSWNECTVPVFINLYIFGIYKFLEYQKSLTDNENRRTATWAGLLVCIGPLPNSIQGTTNLIQLNLTAASRPGFRNTPRAPPSPTSRPPVPSSKQGTKANATP